MDQKRDIEVKLVTFRGCGELILLLVDRQGIDLSLLQVFPLR